MKLTNFVNDKCEYDLLTKLKAYSVNFTVFFGFIHSFYLLKKKKSFSIYYNNYIILKKMIKS